MNYVEIDILNIVDSSYPVFVKCRLIDHNENSHYFIDKLPVVADYDSLPPCKGKLRCKVIEEKEKTYVIDISLPDDIQSTEGKYQFEIYKNIIKA